MTRLRSGSVGSVNCSCRSVSSVSELLTTRDTNPFSSSSSGPSITGPMMAVASGSGESFAAGIGGSAENVESVVTFSEVILCSHSRSCGSRLSCTVSAAYTVMRPMLNGTHTTAAITITLNTVTMAAFSSRCEMGPRRPIKSSIISSPNGSSSRSASAKLASMRGMPGPSTPQLAPPPARARTSGTSRAHAGLRFSAAMAARSASPSSGTSSPSAASLPAWKPSPRGRAGTSRPSSGAFPQ
mmetsp:Transcript_22022/g.56411  ORF Transcript_22022/g.56411 Transcript_22022/m.56411 type:complete len:241 (+) Transcript_22022:863-1585(+)